MQFEVLGFGGDMWWTLLSLKANVPVGQLGIG